MLGTTLEARRLAHAMLQQRLGHSVDAGVTDRTVERMVDAQAQFDVATRGLMPFARHDPLRRRTTKEMLRAMVMPAAEQANSPEAPGLTKKLAKDLLGSSSVGLVAATMRRLQTVLMHAADIAEARGQTGLAEVMRARIAGRPTPAADMPVRGSASSKRRAAQWQDTADSVVTPEEPAYTPPPTAEVMGMYPEYAMRLVENPIFHRIGEVFAEHVANGSVMRKLAEFSPGDAYVAEIYDTIAPGSAVDHTAGDDSAEAARRATQMAVQQQYMRRRTGLSLGGGAAGGAAPAPARGKFAPRGKAMAFAEMRDEALSEMAPPVYVRPAVYRPAARPMMTPSMTKKRYAGPSPFRGM